MYNIAPAKKLYAPEDFRIPMNMALSFQNVQMMLDNGSRTYRAALKNIPYSRRVTLIIEIIPNKTATLSISLPKLPDASKSPPTRAGEPIRSEQPVKKTGYLHVETDPQGAKVYINGNYKGLTPVELVLASGRYTLVLIKDHYKTYSEVVAMGEGAKPLSIRLSPK